jgi:hypothetical protein
MPMRYFRVDRQCSCFDVDAGTQIYQCKYLLSLNLLAGWRITIAVTHCADKRCIFKFRFDFQCGNQQIYEVKFRFLFITQSDF